MKIFKTLHENVCLQNCWSLKIMIDDWTIECAQNDSCTTKEEKRNSETTCCPFVHALFSCQVFLQVLSFFLNMFQIFFLIFFFYSYHKIIATRDLCLAGDRSAFVSLIQGGFYLWLFRYKYIHMYILIYMYVCMRVLMNSLCGWLPFESHSEPLCLVRSACGLACGPANHLNRLKESG